VSYTIFIGLGHLEKRRRRKDLLIFSFLIAKQGLVSENRESQPLRGFVDSDFSSVNVEHKCLLLLKAGKAPGRVRKP